MKFYLLAQFEIAYLKDNKGDILRKFFAPKNQFFIPGLWEFESFPQKFLLKTMTAEEFKILMS